MMIRISSYVHEQDSPCTRVDVETLWEGHSRIDSIVMT